VWVEAMVVEWLPPALPPPLALAPPCWKPNPPPAEDMLNVTVVGRRERAPGPEPDTEPTLGPGPGPGPGPEPLASEAWRCGCDARPAAPDLSVPHSDGCCRRDENENVSTYAPKLCSANQPTNHKHTRTHTHTHTYFYVHMHTPHRATCQNQTSDQPPFHTSHTTPRTCS